MPRRAAGTASDSSDSTPPSFFVKYPVVGLAIVTSVLLASYATAPIRLVQPSNMLSQYCTVEVFQSSLQYIVVKFAQLLNKNLISVTFSVLKLDTLSIFIAEQPLNIYAMSVTFEVLKLDRSSEESDEHESNIEPISFTFDVLKLDMSSEESDEHDFNI